MVGVRRHNSTEHRIEVENNLAETIKWMGSYTLERGKTELAIPSERHKKVAEGEGPSATKPCLPIPRENTQGSNLWVRQPNILHFPLLCAQISIF